MSFAAGASPQRVSMHQSPNILRSPRKARVDVIQDHAMQEERSDGGEEDPVFAALQLACVELGYDRDQESRKKLIGILGSVASGGSFQTTSLSMSSRRPAKLRPREMLSRRPADPLWPFR